MPAKQGSKGYKLNKINVYGACSLHKRENANIDYALLEILELNNIYKMKIALFARKIQNDKNSIPAVFSGALTLASEIHCHHTRYASRQNFYRINTTTR